MADFTYNSGVEQGILQSVAMRNVLGNKARIVAEIAESTAPVGSGPAHDERVQQGEDYKSNIGFDVIEVAGRPAGRAYAKARHSVFVEVGTSKMEPFATLRKALEAGGAV